MCDNCCTYRLIDKLQIYHLSNSRAQIVAYKGQLTFKDQSPFFCARGTLNQVF